VFKSEDIGTTRYSFIIRILKDLSRFMGCSWILWALTIPVGAINIAKAENLADVG
jgi:hypothetical protein